MMKALGGKLVEGRPKHLLTIGQLAAYAGVTIKAVRHYHRRGLLEEPPRDSSGYRRYTAQHAIELVKIKTLAEAGVPLARIKELLAADPDRFAAAIAEIDRNLQQRAEELLRTRERIARLSAGDRSFVSPEVADFLDQLRELGISQRTVQMERDLWILMQAVSPKEAATWMADKRDAISDPEFRAIYVEYDAAFDWSPDDPRLSALADRTARWLANRRQVRGRTKVRSGPGHRPAGCDVGRRIIAGLEPARRDHQGAHGGLVKQWHGQPESSACRKVDSRPGDRRDLRCCRHPGGQLWLAELELHQRITRKRRPQQQHPGSLRVLAGHPVQVAAHVGQLGEQHGQAR
jgi:DNA-binding transcriptional MerR regulator